MIISCYDGKEGDLIFLELTALSTTRTRQFWFLAAAATAALALAKKLAPRAPRLKKNQVFLRFGHFQDFWHFLNFFGRFRMFSDVFGCFWAFLELLARYWTLGSTGSLVYG